MNAWRYRAPKGEGYDPLCEAERLFRTLPTVLEASIEIAVDLVQEPNSAPSEFAAYRLGIEEIMHQLATILGEQLGTVKKIRVRSSFRVA